MPEYIKKFNSNNDYYDFRETEEYTYPNVSHTIAEGEVFYTPVAHYAALLNDTTKVDEQLIVFSLTSSFKGYRGYNRNYIKLSASSTFNKIELDMFRGADSVVVENDEYTSQQLQFTYAMSGNKLTITSSSGSWNGSSLSNIYLKITYKCLNRNCETSIVINERME